MSTSTILPPCPHVWKALASKTMFRCEMCNALGYTKPVAQTSTKPPRQRAILTYSCNQKGCDRPAVVRGVKNSYCSEHRARAGSGASIAKKK